MTRTLLTVALALLPAAGQAARPANMQLVERMAAADTNGDGAVSKPELIAFRGANFDRLDRDANGMLTTSDIPRFAARLNPSLDFNSLLGQFDANRDGQVSRNEFVNGPTAVFDAADANRDGLLTAAERNAAIAAARR